MTGLPADVRAALERREEKRQSLASSERNLRRVLEPYAGRVFEVDGVPTRVSGSPGKLYLRKRAVRSECEFRGEGGE